MDRSLQGGLAFVNALRPWAGLLPHITRRHTIHWVLNQATARL
jgi:hypothetical protein